jgi:hypothetical protein
VDAPGRSPGAKEMAPARNPNAAKQWGQSAPIVFRGIHQSSHNLWAHWCKSQAKCSKTTGPKWPLCFRDTHGSSHKLWAHPCETQAADMWRSPFKSSVCHRISRASNLRGGQKIHQARCGGA